MSRQTPPNWSPALVYLAAFRVGPDQPADPRVVLGRVGEEYGGERSEDGLALEFVSGGVSAYVHCRVEDAIQSFLVALGGVKPGKGGGRSPHSGEVGLGIVDDIKRLLPGGPVYDFELRFARGEEEALGSPGLEGGRRLRCGGVVGGFRLFSWPIGDGSPGEGRSRGFLAIPSRASTADAGEAWELVHDLSRLLALSGQMYALYGDRRLMFEQMEASEASTQMRINEIHAQLRRPVEEIRSSDLEEVLKEITIQFSRLSTLSNTMTRDRVKMEAIFRGLRAVLRGLNERPLEGYVTITSDVTLEHEDIVEPFGAFVGRAEAIQSQLNTVLDSVRTYLGIQQQKLSIAEQASSREQLVRLVNLQEILHKLEILVVAFYLTEMARIVFETLSHEWAGIWTAAFIPFALLISILLGKALNRPH
jgi:hypothetical protein